MPSFAARLIEHAAADGSTLYDVAVDLPDGRDTVIYRGIDREHVESVRADIESGRLDPLQVQTVFRDAVLTRSGRPLPMFVRGVPIPLTWGRGAAGDRWAQARKRIEALRSGA